MFMSRYGLRLFLGDLCSNYIPSHIFLSPHPLPTPERSPGFAQAGKPLLTKGRGFPQHTGHTPSPSWGGLGWGEIKRLFQKIMQFSLQSLVLSFFAIPSHAADTPLTIVVTPTRTAQTADDSLASVSVVTREQIEQRQPQSVADALRGLPGLDFSVNGGRGTASQIFMRGTESDHVLVLIDGVKIGSPTLGQSPFEHLPISQIERIEVVRGPRSSLYGSEALGGVIQIFTRKGGGAPAPSFSMTGGSHETGEASIGLSGGGANSWFNIAAAGTDTQGINSCNGVPGVAGCFVNEPDQDAYRSLSGNARAGMRFDNGAEIDLHWLRTESDIFFDGGFVNEGETMQQVLGGSISVSPRETWRVQMLAGRSWDNSDNFLNGVKRSRFDGTRDTLSLQNDLTFAPRRIFTFGGDFQKDRISSDTEYPVTSRDNYGAFAQYQAGFGPHDAILSLRRDDNEQFGGKTTGNIGWGADMAHGMRAMAAYGTAFKAPTFNELYFPFFGDPDLKPETGRSAEIGLAGRGAFLDWSINLFENRIKNLIGFDAVIFRANNIDTARIRGVELQAGASLAGWQTHANLTLQDPENRSRRANRGKDLPRRSRESLRLDTDREFGRLGVGASLQAAGKRYDDLANREPMDSFVTMDLRSHYRMTENWVIRGKAENLLNQEYETAAHFNQPGRSLFVTLEYQH
jgi:vitamin B12 transporter